MNWGPMFCASNCSFSLSFLLSTELAACRALKMRAGKHRSAVAAPSLPAGEALVVVSAEACTCIHIWNLGVGVLG